MIISVNFQSKKSQNFPFFKHFFKHLFKHLNSVQSTKNLEFYALEQRQNACEALYLYLFILYSLLVLPVLVLPHGFIAQQYVFPSAALCTPIPQEKGGLLAKEEYSPALQVLISIKFEENLNVAQLFYLMFCTTYPKFLSPKYQIEQLLQSRSKCCRCRDTTIIYLLPIPRRWFQGLSNHCCS